jgi:hypothetical protein
VIGVGDAVGVDEAFGLGDAVGVDDAPGLGDAVGVDDAPGLGDAVGVDEASGLGEAVGVDDAPGMDVGFVVAIGDALGKVQTPEILVCPTVPLHFVPAGTPGRGELPVPLHPIKTAVQSERSVKRV